jgi:predicted nucleic acid-binding protein
MMPTYFFDSSALIKRYVNEPGSVWVQTLCEPSAGNHMLIARITSVELLSALAKAYRQGAINEIAMQQLASLIIRDTKLAYHEVPMHRTTYQTARRLILHHAKLGLRAYDAIQLACAFAANRQLLQKKQTSTLRLSPPMRNCAISRLQPV